MLPLFLDLSRLALMLVGDGDATLRRLRRLEEGGARQLAIFAARPTKALAEAAGARLVRRWPARDELAAAHIVFIADPPAEIRTALAQEARDLRVLVHVEDAPALSDAQAPAVLRRGDLTVAVSTNGASPALAVELRDLLGTLFGPDWRARIAAVGRQRQAWKKAGVAPHTVAHLTSQWVRARGWLGTHPRHT